MQAPETEGFGLFLIKGEIGYRLRREVETWFDPGGFRASLSFNMGS